MISFLQISSYQLGFHKSWTIEQGERILQWIIQFKKFQFFLLSIHYCYYSGFRVDVKRSVCSSSSSTKYRFGLPPTGHVDKVYGDLNPARCSQYPRWLMNKQQQLQHRLPFLVLLKRPMF